MNPGDKCPLCETGKVYPRVSTDPWPYKGVTMPAVSVEIPTCDFCHEGFVDRETAKKLDEALEHAYRAAKAATDAEPD